MIPHYAFLPAALYPFQWNVLAVQDQEAEFKVHARGNIYFLLARLCPVSEWNHTLQACN